MAIVMAGCVIVPVVGTTYMSTVVPGSFPHMVPIVMTTHVSGMGSMVVVMSESGVDRLGVDEHETASNQGC